MSSLIGYTRWHVSHLSARAVLHEPYRRLALRAHENLEQRGVDGHEGTIIDPPRMTAAAFVLILSLSGPSVQGAASSPTSPVDAAAQSYFLFLQGRDLEDAGKIDDAIAAFTQAMALTPKASGLHAELAALYARAGRASDAVAEAQAALALDPADRDAHRILGLVQAAVAEQGSTPSQAASLMTQAIGHLAQAVSGGLRDPAAELTLGRLYVRDRQLSRRASTRCSCFCSARRAIRTR